MGRRSKEQTQAIQEHKAIVEDIKANLDKLVDLTVQRELEVKEFNETGRYIEKNGKKNEITI